MGAPSIFEWAGGDAAFQKLTSVFYGHVKQDPVLAPVFADMDERHAEHVAVWLGEVFGGPAAYSGGHARMATKHLGRGITEVLQSTSPVANDLGGHDRQGLGRERIG